MKKYKIVDDSGVDYAFLSGFGEVQSWLGEVVEGVDEPVNGCLTVKQPFGPGTWTADVSCFEVVLPLTKFPKLAAAQDFVDHLRKRLGYGTTPTGGQLAALADCLDEAEVEVGRLVHPPLSPTSSTPCDPADLTPDQFAELHSLEVDFLHLVDSMGSQAAIKFAAEKHFGVFDPVVSRPRWRVFPNMEREPVFAVNPFDQSPADACVFYHMVDGVDHVHVGWSDVRFSLGCFGPRNDDTVKAAGLFLECLRGTVPGKPGAPVVTDRDALSKRLHGLELPLMTISLRAITRIGRSCWFLRCLRNIRRKCLRLLHLGLRKFGNMGDSCGYS